jgi:hypothetical protein
LRTFAPRLPDQPIFYPALNKDYAVKIARDRSALRKFLRWNSDQSRLSEASVTDPNVPSHSGVLLRRTEFPAPSRFVRHARRNSLPVEHPWVVVRTTCSISDQVPANDFDSRRGHLTRADVPRANYSLNFRIVDRLLTTRSKHAKRSPERLGDHL